MTLLFTHADCLKHNPGDGHPERPARLAAVLKALDALEFAALDRREAPEVTRDALLRVHPAAHIEMVLSHVPAEGVSHIDPDTALSPESGDAALRAAGAVVAAVDAVMQGQAKTAFCAVRPPGHHAEPNRAMGFCLFNSIAVGAAHAEAAYKIARVAIVDFDVHHGNGTEAMAATRPNWLYASTHQWPLYPGTGADRDHGPHGNIVNATLAAGSDGEAFRDAFTHRILSALDHFGPELVMISAGFDAHRRDPLAQLELDTADFAWATESLAGIAARHAKGRIVSALEGGYD